MRYCSGFAQVPSGPWVTYWRTHAASTAGLSSQKAPTTRIAVLLGSLLRVPYPIEQLDRIVEDDPKIEWRIFIATADLRMPPWCREELCRIQHLEAISLVDLNQETLDAEDNFSKVMGSRSYPWNSLRQWFKLARAYELMLDYEARIGVRFDAVLKTRSDLQLSHPLSLKNFSELARPVLYGVSDIIFFCNREVAGNIFPGLIARMRALRGTENTLLPIHYDRLLASQLEDSDFFVLNYPCVSAIRSELVRTLQRCIRAAHPTRRVPQRVLTAMAEFWTRHLQAFKLEHFWAAPRPRPKRRNGEGTSWCSGAWWTNETARKWALESGKSKVLGDGRAVQSAKLWFYIVHSAEPAVLWRRWPGGSPFATVGVTLHTERHIRYCS